MRKSRPSSKALPKPRIKTPNIAEFYRSRDYQPVWTGPGAKYDARRSALLMALDAAPDHGLPRARYDVAGLKARMMAADNERDLGQVEVALTGALQDMRATCKPVY